MGHLHTFACKQDLSSRGPSISSGNGRPRCCVEATCEVCLIPLIPFVNRRRLTSCKLQQLPFWSCPVCLEIQGSWLANISLSATASRICKKGSLGHLRNVATESQIAHAGFPYTWLARMGQHRTRLHPEKPYRRSELCQS